LVQKKAKLYYFLNKISYDWWCNKVLSIV